MRCREVEALWDEVREDATTTVKEAVHRHLGLCPPCQDLFSEYEGVAYRLSALPTPEPSCDLTRRVVEHIAAITAHERKESVILTSVPTPIGNIFVGYRKDSIVFITMGDAGDPERVRAQAEQRLRSPVVLGETPAWLTKTLEGFFSTWRVDDKSVDLSDLTPFEQQALRAAASIPPGEVRSYAWIAGKIGRPKAARAVGQAMARNPVPLLMPCHRVVGSSGDLHNYGYGLEMKARLLTMEGYRLER